MIQDCTEKSPMPLPRPSGTRWRHLDEEKFYVTGDDTTTIHFKCPHCGNKTTLSYYQDERLEDDNNLT